MIAAIAVLLQSARARAIAGLSLVVALAGAGVLVGDGSPAGLGGAMVVGALGIALVAAVAASLLPPLEPDPGAAVHRGQTADVSRLLAQSDPDAPGRTRPRAPSRGLPAA